MKEAVTDSFCEGCWYYRGGSTKTCDYIFLEDRPRPCPPGDGCTVRITRKDRIPMKKPTWDTEAGRQMWQEGKSDSEIADAFSISTGAVTSYRLKHWGGGNSARGGRQSSKPDTITRKEDEPVKEPMEIYENAPEAVTPAEEPKAVELFDALEAATLELKGIQAICTANAIQNLWNWTGEEDLLKAKANIDYLLKKLGD